MGSAGKKVAIRQWLLGVVGGAVLAATAATQATVVHTNDTQPSAAASAYDFNYRLSGDRRVAPVQVFDDGRHTWLQYPPGQVLPAIFAAPAPHEHASQVVPFEQKGPYVVVPGTVAALEMRIGPISARADYLGQAPRRGIASGDANSLAPERVGRVHQASNDFAPEAHSNISAPAAASHASAQEPSVSATSTVSGFVARAAVAPDFGVEPLPATVATAARAEPVMQASVVLEFDAALSDKNMRRLLQRWAREAGWIFGPEHWTVDVDIPLVASAAFGADFRSAVRDLLAATELAERPLQPCFYSNRVLRVVPLTQPCDRTVAPGAMPPIS